MKKTFYSHLIEIESVLIKLEEIELLEKEKSHLSELIHVNINHIVLDIVLSELPKEDKKLFLNKIPTDNHESIWKFLKGKTEKIEEKIISAVEELKKQYLRDIEELKKH